MIKWIKTKYFEFKYRFVDEDLCCCGATSCDGDYSHSFRSAKEYAITSAVNKS